jgi:hypothetical protein
MPNAAGKAASGNHSRRSRRASPPTPTPALALVDPDTVRVARFAGVGMDEFLAGLWLSARVCRHPPDDFVDGETIVE